MYILSIVIPTRNRQYYAIECIKQILSISEDDVQIVVTDNSDNDDLRKDIDFLNKKRIKYIYTKVRIPGVDNYSKGIENSDGKYICCIGDDDGVSRHMLDLVHWMNKHEIPAIKFGTQASFIWPKATKEYLDGCAGLGDVSANAYKVCPKNELINFLKSGCIDFPKAKMVKAYHGIVKKDCFSIIFNKIGKYCGGLSPDIYLSTSLSLSLDDLICIDIPFTIFGACKSSTTADSFNGINTGKLEDAPHFVGQKYEWSSLVPRFYCGSNIWVDSALHAITDMDKQEYLSFFSLDTYYSYLLHYHKKYKSEIYKNYVNNGGDMDVLKKKYIKEMPRYYIDKTKSLLRKNRFIIDRYRAIKEKIKKKKGSAAYVRTNIKNISDAEQIMSRSIESYLSKLYSNLEVLVKNNG